MWPPVSPSHTAYLGSVWHSFLLPCALVLLASSPPVSLAACSQAASFWFAYPSSLMWPPRMSLFPKVSSFLTIHKFIYLHVFIYLFNVNGPKFIAQIISQSLQLDIIHSLLSVLLSLSLLHFSLEPIMCWALQMDPRIRETSFLVSWSFL